MFGSAFVELWHDVQLMGMRHGAFYAVTLRTKLLGMMNV